MYDQTASTRKGSWPRTMRSKRSLIIPAAAVSPTP